MKKLAISLLFLVILVTSLDAQDVAFKKGRYISRQNGKPFTGLITEKDSLTGNILSETAILNGYLQGKTTLYFPNGLKKEVREYKEGKKHGVWSTWNEKGDQTALATFSEGKKDGEWIVWDEKGIKRYEMFYRAGERTGTWIIRDEAGKEISRETFK
jgi:antitoxin component YwqK of YwqJK toxin-antitoxin module